MYNEKITKNIFGGLTHTFRSRRICIGMVQFCCQLSVGCTVEWLLWHFKHAAVNVVWYSNNTAGSQIHVSHAVGNGGCGIQSSCTGGFVSVECWPEFYTPSSTGSYVSWTVWSKNAQTYSFVCNTGTVIQGVTCQYAYYQQFVDYGPGGC